MNIAGTLHSKKRKFSDMCENYDFSKTIYKSDEVETIVRTLMSIYESRLDKKDLLISELREALKCKTMCKRPTYIS